MTGDDTGDDVWFALRAAGAMEHGPERTAMLVDAVREADRMDVPRATFLARQSLAEAYRLDGQWERVRGLVAECLHEYDERVWRFERQDEIELLEWYAWFVECMVDFPDLTLDDIHAAHADQLRYLLADSYRHLGDHRAALREYRLLADGDGELAATAFVTGTALLEELGIAEWPT